VSYRLNDEFVAPESDGDEELRRLRQSLEAGSMPERERALRRLIELSAEPLLTECLRYDNASTAQLATAGLWECWLNEEGPAARRRIDEGVRLMNGGQLEGALEIFVELVKEFPRWAEAHNKRATVLYLLGNARLSYQACKLVVDLKPNHFGAWNGMALCAAQLEKWKSALEAAQQALELQPGAQANRDLIALAEQKLREESGQ
jgi:tetratricopeptide (TPR) repeat protein